MTDRSVIDMAPRSVDKEEKTRQILQYATLVFAERGYNTTTIDAIAERAGIAKGSIYQYFKSKQELFFAVFDDHIRQYFGFLEEQSDETPATAEEQIRRVTRITFSMARKMEYLFPLTFEFWAASASSEFRDRFAEHFRKLYLDFRAYFGQIIRAGIESGEFHDQVDVDGATAVLVGSLDGLFLQCWFDREIDPVHAGDAFIDIFLRGLRKHPDRPKTGGTNA